MKGAAEKPASSSLPWAAALPFASADLLGHLRWKYPIEVCQHEDQLWLRGARLEDSLHTELRSLPGARRFNVLPDGQLQPMDARLPQGNLPPGPWVALADFIRPAVAADRPPPHAQKTVPLRMERIAAWPDCMPVAAREPALLLTTAAAWSDYGLRAPQIRLDSWTFALADDGRVLIRGKHPPPIAGVQYAEWENLAIPLGWMWTPAVDASIVKRVIQLPDRRLALFATDGAWQEIPLDEMVRASRAAIRSSIP